jgi:hypothetical protein
MAILVAFDKTLLRGPRSDREENPRSQKVRDQQALENPAIANYRFRALKVPRWDANVCGGAPGALRLRFRLASQSNFGIDT